MAPEPWGSTTRAASLEPKGPARIPADIPTNVMRTPELIVLYPMRQVLASKFGGKPFWRMGDVTLDSKGGAYFSDDNGTYFVNAAGLK